MVTRVTRTTWRLVFESISDSLVRVKMTFIDDEDTDGSSFIWTIENFSYCLHGPGDRLESPNFTLDTPFGHTTIHWPSTFRLRIYPKGQCESDPYGMGMTDMFFGLVLDKAYTYNRTVEFALSIRTTGGSFKKLKDCIHDFNSELKSFGHAEFLKKEELRGEAAKIYLDNDTMTLRCRIMKVDDSIIPPGKCYARTVINVERTTHFWSLEKLRPDMSADELAELQPTSFRMPSSVSLMIMHQKDGYSADGIGLEIKRPNTHERCFLTCDLSLSRAEGEDVYPSREEHWFDVWDERQVWTVPYITVKRISEYEKPHLRCELVVSSGREYSVVERFETGKPNEPALSKYPSDADSLKERFVESWKDDLQRFSTAGEPTDFTIRTRTKDFPVHRAILCAKSTVFHDLLEQDTRENRTGVVNIEDVDADTVHKMLKFVYSDTLEDLDCDVACKLYFAADKYRITALRTRCSDFLKQNPSVVNACQVLVLADMHQDEELKSFVQDLVVNNPTDVIRSEEWKKLMKDQIHLAADIMYTLCLRNSSS